MFHKCCDFFSLDEELLASQVKTSLSRISVPPATAINFPVQLAKTAFLNDRNQEQMQIPQNPTGLYSNLGLPQRPATQRMHLFGLED